MNPIPITYHKTTIKYLRKHKFIILLLKKKYEYALSIYLRQASQKDLTLETTQNITVTYTMEWNISVTL